MNISIKQVFYSVALIGILLLVAVFLSQLGQSGTNQVTENIENADKLEGDAVFTIDVLQSNATWSGSRALAANYSHTGTIAIATGTVSVVDGNISSSRIVFDMKTIRTTGDGNEAPAGGSQLDKHLMSADFFDSVKYPASIFTFKSVVPGEGVNNYMITGDLTIKDVTKAITFPAQVYMKDGLLYIVGSTMVDRTEWNIRYGSGKFFQNLGDKVIADEFELTFNLVGRAPFAISSLNIES
jgi:polyisoprenoid-binding protein YceI